MDSFVILIINVLIAWTILIVQIKFVIVQDIVYGVQRIVNQWVNCVIILIINVLNVFKIRIVKWKMDIYVIQKQVNVNKKFVLMINIVI